MEISRSEQPDVQGFYEISGHRLYWEQYGSDDAPALLLLHNGLGSIRSWRRQCKAFSDNGFRVIAYDRWGYGRSDARPSFEDRFLEKDAEEALAFLEHLCIHRVSLLGHSDGGSIALMMAAERQDLVERMVVVAAHIYIEPKMLLELESIAEISKRKRYAKVLAREHGNKVGQLIGPWVQHWIESDPQKLNLRELLPKITCPTLVIQGELDEHATAQQALDIASGVQNGQVWLIPDVHHMPPYEIPEEFNRVVLRFMTTPVHADAPVIE